MDVLPLKQIPSYSRVEKAPTLQLTRRLLSTGISAGRDVSDDALDVDLEVSQAAQ